MGGCNRIRSLCIFGEVRCPSLKGVSWILRFDVPSADVELISSQLWDADTTGVAEIAAGDQATLLAGFEKLAEARAAASRFGGVVEPVSTDSWAITDLSTVDVAGTTLTLEVGTAFGHGAHETTKLALDGLRRASEESDLGAVLDVGSGTGVLALGAGILGASSALGIDIDHAAVEIASRNVARNQMLVGRASIAITTEQLDTLAAPFDTVVANMLLADIRPLAPTIERLTSQRLIVSGFLVEQADQIRDLFGGLQVVDHRHEGDWAMLRFKA